MARPTTTPYFVDTNVLVYARDIRDAAKQEIAERWLRTLWAAHSGRVSTQVLNEYYAVMTQKLKPGLDRAEARADIQSLMVWSPIPVDRVMIEGAWIIQDRHGLAWWDSLIVSAAQVAGCAYLLTEDLEHEHLFDGVRVIDPFRTAPPS